MQNQDFQLANPAYKRHADYWAARLSSLDHRFNLRGSRLVSTPFQELQHVDLILDECHQKIIERLTGGRELESFIIHLAAWSILFSRYQDDPVIVIDSPLLKAIHHDPVRFERVPLLITFGQAETIRDVIMIVDRTVTDSYRYQNYPLERLRGVRTDVAQTNVLAGSPSLHLEMSNLEPYDFIFDLRPSPGSSAALARLLYNPEKLDAWFVQNTAAHYKTILGQFENPATPLGSLALLTEAEQRQLLIEFNASHVNVTPADTLVDRFRSSARRAPGQIAARSGDAVLTYRELDDQSTRMAAYLMRALNVKRGDIVCLLFRKSLLALISILGILKAGAAYVAINPTLPASRILSLLEHGRMDLLITESNFLLDLYNYEGQIFVADIQADEWQAAAAMSGEGPAASDLAYLMYTSGSTGAPKGVCIEHRSILSYLEWKLPYYGFNRSSVTLQLASLAFDSSVSDLFCMLACGGSLVLVEEEDRLNVQKLIGMINWYGVTHFAIVPSLYRLVLEGIEEAPETLKVVTVAGERATPDLVETHFRKLAGVRLINEYGPAENSVCSTAYDLSAARSRTPLIGKPISNTSVYVLNGQGQMVPVGCQGEICISGQGLARGYFNQPSLTGAKFVPHPYIRGERMYKTGDLGRWLPDGNLEFIGRKDGELKVRGQRVETVEIEAALLSVPKIKEAVVTGRERVPGEIDLIAYFTHEEGLSVAQVRRSLSRLLPLSLLPSHYIVLDRFPLTPSGKIDQEALAQPSVLEANSPAVYEAPRDDLEEQLCFLWEQLLGRDKLGIAANFFECGGHSLKAVQFLTRLQKEFHMEASLRDIFEAPTIKELSGILRRKGANDYKGIEPVARQAHYELSHAQRRLWLLDQFEGGDSAAYNLPDAYLFEGTFDEDAFANALNQLLQRHEVLRTRFIVVKGEPRQEILENVECDIERIDLTGEDQPQAHALDLVNGDARVPFDLGTWPLLRIKILKVESQKHIVMLTIHHIISDGWSIDVLVKELLGLYALQVGSRHLELEPLRFQYKDYAAWQNRLLKSEAANRHRDYWLEKLKKPLTVLDLPADSARPPLQTFNGRAQRFHLSRRDTLALRQFSQEAGVSMFMLAVALVKVLLYQYTRQPDIIVGSPIAGRSHPDLESQVGFYINTLVLRDQLNREDTFWEILGKVRKTILDAFEHQIYPFDVLVEEVDTERDVRRHPLFDVMVAMDEFTLESGLGRLAGEPLDVSRITPEFNVSKFDLTVMFNDTTEVLVIDIQYNSDLFNTERIKRMATHVKSLFGSILLDPDQRLDDIEMISAAERRQVLEAFNQTRADYPSDCTAISLFEEQVERTPNAPAVVFEEVRLNYAELNRRANAVAHLLKGQYRVGNNDIVPVIADRSELLIIAILGIMKAGAAYLPIDPAYPDRRIEYILRDSRAAVALVRQRDVAAIAGAATIEIIDLEALSAGADSNLPLTSSANDLAYVIYTSGSTGDPNGVMIEHRSLVNLAYWQKRAFQITRQSRSAQYASVGFDASVIETWPFLLSGACVYPIPARTRLSVEELCTFYCDHEITHAFLPPAVFDLVCRAQSGVPNSDFTFLVGGDVLNAHGSNRWRTFNLYGPTESTVVASAFRLPAGDLESLPPIGKPIDNAWIYILNDNLRPVPIGVPGEICISGVGLARGYLRRPELTVERFPQHPFKEGERLYRTGDIGRWLADGNIEFIGRRDERVKVRGIRVELGEIESVALRHPLVGQAAILAEDSRGDKRLFLYVVPIAGQRVNPQEVHDFLQERLPASLMPSAIIPLSVLPLTPNGKIDKRALPVPQPAQVEASAPPGQSPIREVIAAIWADLLGLEHVGMHDDFFALGGHSLMAMKVIFRVREIFGVGVELRKLFQAPTVAAMADGIEKMMLHKAGQPIPALRPAARDLLPLSALQEHLWRLDRVLPGTSFFNMSCTARFGGPLDLPILRRALDDIVMRHELLRTTFADVDGQPVQRVAATPAALDVRDLSDLSPAIRERDRDRHIQEESKQPFDLARGPLVRFLVLRLTDAEHILVCTTHHIIGDARSLGLLLGELADIYRAYAHREAWPLTDLPIQYADFAVWQRDCIENQVFDYQLSYWKDKLGGEPPALVFPWNRDQALTLTFRTSHRWVALPQSLHLDLKRLGRREGCTLFMALLAGFKILLSRYTGLEDIEVATNVDTRNRGELEGLIGPFINTAVLRTDLSGNPTLGDVVRGVRGTVLDAYAHQDVPFEQVVQALEQEYARKPRSWCRAMLLLQDAAPAARSLPGLMIDMLDFGAQEEPGATITTFDLILTLQESPKGLTGLLIYKDALFTSEVIQTMIEDLQKVLELLCKNTEMRLSSLSLQLP
jgi:amino acid adenylation domain-containing protein